MIYHRVTEDTERFFYFRDREMPIAKTYSALRAYIAHAAEGMMVLICRCLHPVFGASPPSRRDINAGK